MSDEMTMVRPVTNYVPAKGQMDGGGSAPWGRFETLTFDGAGVSQPIARRDPYAPAAPARMRARFDGSREQFMVNNPAKVSELLAALPMLKADPILATPITVGSPSPTMQLSIRTPNAAPDEPSFYNASNSPTSLTVKLQNSPSNFPLARLGLAFKALDADSMGTAVQTSMNAMHWQAQTAAIGVLRKLDKSMAQGTGAETVPSFYGLATLCAGGRTAATSTDVEKDVRNLITQIVPNAGGAGEGIDCLIGGPKVLRKLMSTASGQRGMSGFKLDPRLGRSVYHYMGIPYYRCEVDESTTGRLYGANLGASGLSLVYLLGSPQSFGLTVDVFADPITLQKQAVVHGVFALVPWDFGAVYEITGIDLTSL